MYNPADYYGQAIVRQMKLDRISTVMELYRAAVKRSTTIQQFQHACKVRDEELDKLRDE